MTLIQKDEMFESASVCLKAILCLCVALSLPAIADSAEVPEPRSETDKRDSVEEPAPDLNVVAHWRFQDGIAGSATDASQLIKDSSGNALHGRAVGGPKYHAVELPTTSLALAFDGRDDRIAVADNPHFYLTKSFTIEAWFEVAFFPESRQNRAFIAFRGDNRAGFDPWFLAVEESGQMQFLIANSLNEASVVHSPEPLPTRQFVHVAAVLDDESGKQSLFINGKRVASTKTKLRAGGPLGGTGPGIGLGGRQDRSHQGFRGSIAELRICAAALTPSQFLLPREK